MCIRCRGNSFTEPLPSNIDMQTRWWETFMKYTAQISLGAIIY
jgi:hypothetical protein